MKTEAKDKIIKLRASEDLKRKVLQHAKKQNETLSNFLRKVIEAELKKSEKV